MNFKDIKRKPWGNYQTNVPVDSLIHNIKRWQDPETMPTTLNLEPDFQRAHVWTQEQQIAYVEFVLSDGRGANTILFNCVGWMRDFRGPFVIVDGKQRLRAMMDYLENKIPAYGHYYKDMEGRLDSCINLIFVVNNLENYKDVLEWYIDLNAGGTPHSQDEIDKVREMIDNLTE